MQVILNNQLVAGWGAFQLYEVVVRAVSCEQRTRMLEVFDLGVAFQHTDKKSYVKSSRRGPTVVEFWDPIYIVHLSILHGHRQVCTTGVQITRAPTGFYYRRPVRRAPTGFYYRRPITRSPTGFYNRRPVTRSPIGFHYRRPFCFCLPCLGLMVVPDLLEMCFSENVISAGNMISAGNAISAGNVACTRVPCYTLVRPYM